MRALVAGASGQLGQELLRNAPPDVSVRGISRVECDIVDADRVRSVIDEFLPDVVINAAAFTAVDKAETEVDRAFAVNASGAGNVARAAVAARARVIQISTDYVFDGRRSTPYPPSAETRPLNVYGKSKLAGEFEVLGASERAVVLRTGWLYSAEGTNFLRTILTQLSSRTSVYVVNDQVGVPTSARDLARTIWALTTRGDIAGVHHWVNQSTASWYEFAVEIERCAFQRSIVPARVPIEPITTRNYGSKTRRPAYSVLDAGDLWHALGHPVSDWRAAVATTLDELKSSSSEAAAANRASRLGSIVP